MKSSDIRSLVNKDLITLLASSKTPLYHAQEVLEAAVAADANDLTARHLLAVYDLVGGRAEDGLKHLLEMLKRDRHFQNDLPRKTLIDAFRIIDDEDLVSRYRRQMSSLLLA